MELTLNNSRVVYSKKHMRAHADVIPLLQPALNRVGQLPVGVSVVSIDMGYIVGRSGVVRTGPDDDIVYMRRPGRRHPSRCVRGRVSEESSVVTLVINTALNGYVRLITAWIGTPSPREVGDTSMSEEERQVSIDFWAEHAFVI